MLGNNQLSVSTLKEAHQIRIGKKPSIIIRAPGRVELAGKHLDYMLEKVMPFSTTQAIWLSNIREDTGKLCVYSEQWGDGSSTLIKTDKIKSSVFDPRAYQKKEALIYAIVHIFCKKFGVLPKGGNIYADSDIPMTAGVSSSAAWGCAWVALFNEILLNGKLTNLEMAKLEQEAEHMCGSKVGLLDQIGCLEGQENMVVSFDPLTEEITTLPWPRDIGAVVLFTGFPRKLEETRYLERRTESEKVFEIACKFQGISANRLSELKPNSRFLLDPEITPLLTRRYYHLRDEIERVKKITGWLLYQREKKEHRNMWYDTDMEFGRHIYDSHISITNNHEIGHPASSIAVWKTLKLRNIVGASQMGAGFGGSCVALFRECSYESDLEECAQNWLSSYNDGLKNADITPPETPIVLPTRPSQGLQIFKV